VRIFFDYFYALSHSSTVVHFAILRRPDKRLIYKFQTLSHNLISSSRAGLRQIGSEKILYPSVKHESGVCIATFWPDVIGIPIQARHFTYHFNGEIIAMYRDETNQEVFKIIV